MANWFLDMLSGAEEKRAAELSRRNAEENQRRIDRGLMTPEEAAVQQARFDADQSAPPVSHNPNDPLAEPDLDGWGPDTWWTPADWQRWFEALKSRFGDRDAILRWNEAWAQQGIGSGPLDARLNPEFRAWADANGLDLYYGAGVIAEPIGAAAEVVSGVSKGVTSVGRAGSWLVPLGVAAVVLWFAGPTFLKGTK